MNTPPTVDNPSADVVIRDIAAQSSFEIDLVASRMFATLVEVEGPANAVALHSPEWIRERLLWHINNPEVVGRALVAVLPSGEVIGHTVLRRESEAGRPNFGLISTTYVAPPHRGKGVASRFLASAEGWFHELELSASETWTADFNHKLIRLYKKHGYRIARSGENPVTRTLMVNLSKAFNAENGAV